MFSKKITCEVCGCRLIPTKEAVYQTRSRLSLIAPLTGEPSVFDTIDCPRCGCQILLKIRGPKYIEDSEDEGEENGETDNA